MMKVKEKVVVAMSGGVDSSTVAAMMVEEGHEVIGVTLQLYDQGLALQKKGACCAGQDIYDARNVADKLNIPHYVLDYESLFKESVIDDFVESYVRGETPIPCVRCNQSVKFRDLYKFAKDLGADRLVTGHYVRRLGNKEQGYELHQGVDPKKDQSYFLFATSKEQLEFIDFPLGSLTKEETRKLAHKFELETADKPDSQDICFVPDGDYAKVIKQYLPSAEASGEIRHIATREILGEHEGVIHYTVGQRRGLGIAWPEPLYVVKIDPGLRVVYVGEKHYLAESKAYINSFNWLGGTEDFTGRNEYFIKLRSAHRGTYGTINKLDDDLFEITFLKPEERITPGQALVMYEGSRVVGGGFIISDSIFK